MTSSSVIAGAVYIPACVVKSRRGEHRVCAADEDAVTLAVEAGSQALRRAPAGRNGVDAVIVALRDDIGDARPGGVDAQVVREALGLPSTVRVVTLSGADSLSGLAALQGAWGGTTLVLAADSGRGRSQACGAALLAVSDDTPANTAVRLVEVARASGLTHERWNGSDSPGHEPDSRFLEHRYASLACELASHPDLAALTDVTRIYAAAATKTELGHVTAALDEVSTTALARDRAAVDRGIAGPLAAIVEAALQPPPNGSGVLYTSGSGQAVLLRVGVPEGISAHYDWFEPAETHTPVAAPVEGPELSLPVESPFFVRNWGPSLRLEAAKCASCGHIAFPASQRPICAKCHGRQWHKHTLASEGRVYASLQNKFLPVGFPRSLVFVLGELDDGVKYWAPAPAETAADELRIGDRVRLGLRCFTNRNGITVYGMKFIPEKTETAAAGSSAMANTSRGHRTSGRNR